LTSAFYFNGLGVNLRRFIGKFRPVRRRRAGGPRDAGKLDRDRREGMPPTPSRNGAKAKRERRQREAEAAPGRH
jgi:hypothetical protein